MDGDTVTEKPGRFSGALNPRALVAVPDPVSRSTHEEPYVI